MDLVGKLKCTNNGYMYICVMVDYFTKWIEVTRCIMDFFYKYGAPKRILTDRGKEFVNKINTGLCESLCAPYHPQTNGLVEKLNGTIQGALKKMVQDHPSDWDKYIQPTVFGLRTKKQLTTKYSPYFLLYGREARYPSEIPDKWQISEEQVHIYMTNEDVCTHTNDLKEVYNKVEANIAETQEKVRKRKLAKGDDDSFAVGDKVLRKNIREEQRKGGKLETDLLGPYMAIHIDGKSADLTTLQGKNVCKVNIDHLKRYVEPEVRIPAKWIAATSTSPPALQPSPVRCLGVPQSPPVAPKSDSLTSSLSSWPAPASPEECKYKPQYSFNIRTVW
uniref:Integrase catalytic domain-containing protein n=1 Tax=Gasterosteus aculeatus aculeatus TaxID=481459 RepID=A0AAQ4QPV2_GASAC